MAKAGITVRKKTILLIVTLLCSIILLVYTILSRRGGPASGKYTEARMLMGTFVRLDTCRSAPDKDAAYAHAWERLEDIAWRMNVYDERSEVTRINNARFEPAYVGKDTYAVLERSASISEATAGAFDITVRPLIELWKDSAAQDTVPEQGQLDAVLQAVGRDKLILLSDNRVKLADPRTKIDLGGIGKGYAVDEAARIFREHGIRDFFIDAGGDVYAGGTNCSGRPWRVGIKDPRDQAQIIDVVEVTDRAVMTSGNYEQFLVIRGEHWSHILDPRTGFPQKEVVSATVIGPEAMDADAMATALCVLGGAKGVEYMDTAAGQYDGLIIVRQGPADIEQFRSQGYGTYRPKE